MSMMYNTYPKKYLHRLNYKERVCDACGAIAWTAESDNEPPPVIKCNWCNFKFDDHKPSFLEQLHEAIRLRDSKGGRPA